MSAHKSKSFLRTILHIDADSFFAACEQAINPALRGKPVIIGKERGVASAISVEAKLLGIKRGMRIRDIKTLFPHVICLPSNYEIYSLFSKRMAAIIRHHIPKVEEYSIDECFADITHLYLPSDKTRISVVSAIKKELETKLNLTFSVGIGPTKTTAKIASQWKKPSGYTVLSLKTLPSFLARIPVEKIWGVGTQTAILMRKYGIHSALDFIQKPEPWIKNIFTKPHQELWHELRGKSIWPVNTCKNQQFSFSKRKTFSPPSQNCDYIFAQLSQNIEDVCAKARRYHLYAKHVSFSLRTQQFTDHRYSFKLDHPTNHTHEVITAVRRHFKKCFVENESYRATSINISQLTSCKPQQQSLFEKLSTPSRKNKIYMIVDALNVRFGKNTISLGSSFFIPRDATNLTKKRECKHYIKQNIRQKNIAGLPFLGEVR